MDMTAFWHAAGRPLALLLFWGIAACIAMLIVRGVERLLLNERMWRKHPRFAARTQRVMAILTKRR